MVWRHDPGINMKRPPRARDPRHPAQGADNVHQGAVVPVARINGEEEGATRHPVAAIIQHAPRMRDADRIGEAKRAEKSSIL